MKKMLYKSPQTDIIYMGMGAVMVTASPGVNSGFYEPGDPIDAKKSNYWEDEEEILRVATSFSAWDYSRDDTDDE